MSCARAQSTESPAPITRWVRVRYVARGKDYSELGDEEPLLLPRRRSPDLERPPGCAPGPRWASRGSPVRPIQEFLARRSSNQNRPCVNTLRCLVMVVAGSSRPGKVQAPFLGRVRKQTRRSLEATIVSRPTLYGSHADFCARRLSAG